MRKPRPVLALAALLAALIPSAVVAQGPDMAKVDQLRSLVAEAVALGRAVADDRVTATYAEGLRGDIRKSLKALLKDPVLGASAREAMQALDIGDQRTLTALRDRLVRLEGAHGRAG